MGNKIKIECVIFEIKLLCPLNRSLDTIEKKQVT